MKKYFYFGKDKRGVMVPLFECVADEAPTPAETNAIYREMVAKAGLGVPRPTHYAALNLIEVEQSDEEEAQPLVLHANGDATVH